MEASNLTDRRGGEEEVTGRRDATPRRGEPFVGEDTEALLRGDDEEAAPLRLLNRGELELKDLLTAAEREGEAEPGRLREGEFGVGDDDDDDMTLAPPFLEGEAGWCDDGA